MHAYVRDTSARWIQLHPRKYMAKQNEKSTAVRQTSLCAVQFCVWELLFDAGCLGGIKDSNDFPFQTTANHRAEKLQRETKRQCKSTSESIQPSVNVLKTRLERQDRSMKASEWVTHAQRCVYYWGSVCAYMWYWQCVCVYKPQRAVFSSSARVQERTRVLPVSVNMIHLIQMTQIPFQFSSHLLLLHFHCGWGEIENYTVKNDHNFNK